MFFWLFTPDPFGGKRLEVFANDNQICRMIENGLEDFRVDRIGNQTIVLVPDSFWNRRKLKKLKIRFKSKS